LQTSLKHILIIISILIVGILLRSIHIGDTFTPRGIEFLETDPFYHAHQTLNLDESFPKLPMTDLFLNHPYGQKTFPGGFSFITVLIAKILGISGEGESMKALSAVMPLFWFVLAALLFYFLSKKSYFFINTTNDKMKPVLALLLFTILPQSIFHTTIGKYDHHILEIVFMLLTLFFVSELIEKPKISKALLFGALLGLMPFFWAQGSVFLGVFSLAGCFYGRIYFAVSAAVAFVVFCILAVLHGDVTSISPHHISLAQPAIGLVSILIAVLGVSVKKKNLLGYVGVLIIFVIIFTFRTKFVLLSSSIISSVLTFSTRATESLPLTLSGLWEMHLAYSFILLPVLLAPYLIFLKRKKELSSKLAGSSLIFLTLSIIFMLFQIRFQTMFVTIYVILLVEFFLLAKQTFEENFSTKKFLKPVAVILFMIFIPFNLFTFDPISNSKIHKGFVPFKNACLYLKDKTAGLDRSKLGVLTKWDYGHWVLYYCEMPTVTNPLASPYHAGTRLFYSEDMGELKLKLQERKVKYIISILPNKNFQLMAEDLGLKKNYMSYRNGYWLYEKEIFNTLNGRLSFLLNAGIPGWMKIVYVSPEYILIDKKKLPLVVVAEIK